MRGEKKRMKAKASVYMAILFATFSILYFSSKLIETSDLLYLVAIFLCIISLSLALIALIIGNRYHEESMSSLQDEQSD